MIPGSGVVGVRLRLQQAHGKQSHHFFFRRGGMGGTSGSVTSSLSDSDSEDSEPPQVGAQAIHLLPRAMRSRGMSMRTKMSMRW